MAVEIGKRHASLELELYCGLQANPFLSTKVNDVCFWKKLPLEKYPLLR